MDKVAYSIAEVLQATSLGRTRVYEAIKAGKIKTRKFGGRRIVLAEDLRAFLKSLPEGRAA